MEKAILVAIGVFIIIDVAIDVWAGESIEHLLTEGAILSLIGLAFALLWLQSRSQSKTLDDLSSEVDRLRKDSVYWKSETQSLLAGLGRLIDEQFVEWNLTEAEKEVGLLLLKGFTHKEIAAIRNSSDRTVRHQATSLYNKASLENRAQLSAFFLEDLFLPKAQ